MTEFDRKEVIQAMAVLNLFHRDVVIAITLALTENVVPFERQICILPVLQEILQEMGIARVVSKQDLIQYLKVMKRAGLAESVRRYENRSENIVTLTETGKLVPIYYSEMSSAESVDLADVHLVQWYFHRKWRLMVGDCMPISKISTELRLRTQFAKRFAGASVTMFNQSNSADAFAIVAFTVRPERAGKPETRSWSTVMSG